MTFEDICEAFAQLYPTEFKHVLAEVRVKELEAQLEEADDGDTVPE
jgi:hypothetical protein